MNRERIDETLKNARAILAERGLARRTFVDPDGRVCGLGALNIAIHGRARPVYGTDIHLELECRKALGFPSSMTHWFDEECGSLDEALARFDEAIGRSAPEPEPSLA